jgi:hypothetical protein
VESSISLMAFFAIVVSIYFNYSIYKFTVRDSILIGLISGVVYFGVKMAFSVDGEGANWKDGFSVLGVLAVYCVLRFATPDLFKKRS